MLRQMKTIKNHGQQGFTLVELMVVVAIIGILAAVSGPRIQQFRARGTQSEAKANLNSIYLAQAAYQDANDEFAGGEGTTCDEGEPCAGLAFVVNKGSRYTYGVTGGDGAWAAGAVSKQKILNGINDIWRINTNKVLCAVEDALGGEKYACDGGEVAAETAIPTLGDDDNAQ